MSEFKGSILELNNKKAIVLTDKCDFISIKRTPEMVLGQQLTFSEAYISKKPKAYIRYGALAAGIFVLAIFSILFLQVFNPVNTFAYIDVDINPSLEFVVDDSSTVLSVKALNSDAQRLLKDLELKDIPVKAAISKVLDSSKELGYISPDKTNEVLISASLESVKVPSAAISEKALSSILTEIEGLSVKTGSENLHPKVLKVTPEVRKAAVANNISMGRYELYNEINKTDKKITIENAKTERISDMLNKTESKVKDKVEDKKSSKDKEFNKKAIPGKTNSTESLHNPDRSDSVNSDKSVKSNKSEKREKPERNVGNSNHKNNRKN